MMIKSLLAIIFYVITTSTLAVAGSVSASINVSATVGTIDGGNCALAVNYGKPEGSVNIDCKDELTPWQLIVDSGNSSDRRSKRRDEDIKDQFIVKGEYRSDRVDLQSGSQAIGFGSEYGRESANKHKSADRHDSKIIGVTLYF